MLRTSPTIDNPGTSQADLATVLESFPANIAYVDADLVYRFVNREYETVFACRREDIVGRKVADVLGVAAFAMVEPKVRRALAGEVFTHESEYHFPGRPPLWLDVHYLPRRTAAGEIAGLFVFAVDINRRRHAELDLQESEARYRLLYEQAPIGIEYYDREGRLLQLNRRAAEEFGTLASVAVGRTLRDLLGEDVATPFLQRQREVLLSGHVQEHVDEVELESGRKWFLSSYAPVPGPDGVALGVQIVSSDITALKMAEQRSREMEDRLRQSQKLQAMGSLAGGVAHDFNNILQTVLSFTCEMLDDAGIAPQHRDDLGVVRDACRRGGSLTAQLLAFSRQQCLSPQALDAHESITSVFKMVRRLIGENVELAFDFGAARSGILADEGQLAQILLNLVVNARDAMPNGGCLTVSTENRTIAESAVDGLKAGDYLVIGLRDAGCGMSADTMQHVFEPFFTTKNVGCGTGLGLATVHGIVKQHGGHIDVTSRLGSGSYFEVLLPLHDETGAAAAGSEPGVAVGGSETILLAEDDAAVRTLFERCLRRAGYRVLTAADGHAAVAVHRENVGAIDLAVLDVVMPGRSGRQVFKAMQALDPDLGVLFLSGYPLDREDGLQEWDTTLPLLRKPMTCDVLCREVRRQLDRIRVR